MVDPTNIKPLTGFDLRPTFYKHGQPDEDQCSDTKTAR